MSTRSMYPTFRLGIFAALLFTGSLLGCGAKRDLGGAGNQASDEEAPSVDPYSIYISSGFPLASASGIVS